MSRIRHLKGVQMIDWITSVIPFHHKHEICGGAITKTSSDGELEWMTKAKFKVEGSHSSKIFVKTSDIDSKTGFYNEIYISGNPSKFLQGHNIFGSSDLVPLNYLFFNAIAKKLNLVPTVDNLLDWENGEYDLFRVDINESFILPSQSDVFTWLKSCGDQATSSRQGRYTETGETVQFGSKSRRINHKFYNKHRELKSHPLPENILHRDKLLELSKNLLRYEVKLLSIEIKKRGLRKAKSWNSNIQNKILKERIKTMRINTKFILTPTELGKLPPKLETTYLLWRQGVNIKEVFSKSKFYDHRKELIKYGIDILVINQKKAQVVPLLKFLTAEHISSIPNFAIGTDLYVETSQGLQSPNTLRLVS